MMRSGGYRAYTHLYQISFAVRISGTALNLSILNIKLLLMIYYHLHKHYKKLYEDLNNAISIFSENQNFNYEKFKEWLFEQFSHDIKPLSYWLEHDPRGADNYPSEEFLISLSESEWDITFDQFIGLIHEVWNDFCMENYFTEENGVYTLYTVGWSGNEHILDAMQSNIEILIHVQISQVENHAIYHIKERGK